MVWWTAETTNVGRYAEDDDIANKQRVHPSNPVSDDNSDGYTKRNSRVHVFLGSIAM